MENSIFFRNCKFFRCGFAKSRMWWHIKRVFQKEKVRKMKIAVSCTQDQVAPALTMTGALAVFEVENGAVRRTVHRVCADSSPQAVAEKLLADDVDLVICGRVSAEAGTVLTNAGIMFIAGISGAPRTVVERYLDGTLPLDGGR